MKRYFKPFQKVLLLSFLLLLACNDKYLELKPIGAVDESILATRSGVNGVLIGAYSLLDGAGAVGGGIWGSLTVMASVASDDAHTGTEPNGLLASYEGYSHDPTTSSTDEKWRFLYAAVQRSNDVLRLLPKVTDISEADALQIKAEALFLRGVYHLELAKHWRNIPFVDETVTYTGNNYNVTNTEPVWPKIEADLQFAAANLTPVKADVGRANSWAAKAFLAKVYMFQNKFTEAKTLLDDIITSGVTVNGKKYALAEGYFDNFLTAKKHGAEVVFAVQMSVYDGSNGANGNGADLYNGPFGGPPSCCYGWLQPSFDLVNAYQTDPVTGLPLFDTYNQNPVKNDQGMESSEPFTPHTGTLDARLDWVVGRRGIPYLDWGLHPGKAWIRQQSTGGPYSVIKNITTQARVSLDRENAAMNSPYNMIRFADVLLWAAEVEVEVGSLVKAEEYVNKVRARAANPAGWVKKYIDDKNPLKGFTDVPAANYKVGLYKGHFSQQGKEYARKAVRFERRLELALEHQRFFDLQRYDNGTGYMANVLNTYLNFETNVPKYDNKAYMPNTNFTKGKNEIYPIPQAQIDLSMKDGTPTLKQNPGY
ncbi:RagB/SusD family nutrient uptake outer membrane protein [Dyadobacter aurulentus]|uniref:RagB/SusD family nutrient uptake outer membrane protein n=1 Tax=Dyadobacter sp. UC 10 TaxID=2605428 RepID=UPI0011F29943|nr:RagB/SusD family nutrient uptake outer membrane protein [Dyadobacter sp. UC 10]KAA0993531.1 RagB/SusD family nutrient uptake outer membrane protein [Dyadobacter sp. UC 10]